jgi:HEAT repeat protein
MFDRRGNALGRIYDSFNKVTFASEAEVSLRFTVPLIELLGFSKNEIVPEHNYPSKEIFYGIKNFSSKDFPKSQRPDYVVCLNGDLDKVCFVVDSKDSKEELNEHLEQLKSYSSGAKTNFLVITNGKNLKVYYGQEEVLSLLGLEEIDIFFPKIRQLLSKESFVKKTPLEIIKGFDQKQVASSRKDISEKARFRTRLELSDYYEYAMKIKYEFLDWHGGNIFSENLEFSKVPPQMLHTLKARNINKEEFRNPLIDPDGVFTRTNSRVKIIYGPSGIGKTTLLRFWAHTQADKCVNLTDLVIPVFVELKNYGLNRNIKSLIQNALSKRGCVCSNESLSTDLLNKRFLFFLDGFDEIAQNYQSDAISEIVELSEDYPTHQLILSSRSGQELHIPASLSFDIQPLDRERIELIVEMNLGPRKYDFLNKLYQLGLMNQMGNTLLLLLTINVFQIQSEIPISRTKIIDNSIAGLEKWAESKTPKMQTKINSRVKLELLEKIAYFIKQEDLGTSIVEPELTGFFSQQLEYYEKIREIPSGVDKICVYKELSATGFVHIDEYGLSFNSTMFLNYFAARELCKLFLQKKEVLEDKINKLAWQEVIIIMASKLPDVNNLVLNFYQKGHLLMAVACAIENQGVEESTMLQLANDLEQCCDSVLPTIRSRSLYYLTRVDTKYTKEIFCRLANSSHIDVKACAIETLSKVGDSVASKIIYENLDWDKGSFEVGSTQGTIAKALANLSDETSHLKIADIWKKKKDIFTSEDCRLAMLQLVYKKQLTSKIRDTLLDIFLSTPEDHDVGYWDRLRGIADVFIALGDESISDKLINGLTDNEKYFARLLHTPKILASFKSQTIFDRLVKGSLDQQKPPKVRQAMIEAIVDSKYFKAELPFLEKLFSDNHREVKRAAIKGLSKYAAYEVKDILLRLIRDKDMGGEATELLGDFGLLTILMEKDRFPHYFFPEPLFEQIRKHGLMEFLPRLDKIQEKWLADERTDQNERFLFDLAHTYVILGQMSKALKIIDSFYVDGKLSFQGEYSCSRLMELSSTITGYDGLKILEDCYKLVEDSRKSGAAPKAFEGIFMDDKYLENLEKIGGERAIEILVCFCEKHIGDMLFERAMRAIVTLAPKSKEDWLIQLLEKNSQLKGPELHRAIEALGIIGTEKSIPVLKKVAKTNSNSEYITNTCLWALEYTYNKKGEVTVLEDKDVLND